MEIGGIIPLSILLQLAFGRFCGGTNRTTQEGCLARLYLPVIFYAKSKPRWFQVGIGHYPRICTLLVIWQTGN